MGSEAHGARRALGCFDGTAAWLLGWQYPDGYICRAAVDSVTERARRPRLVVGDRFCHAGLSSHRRSAEGSNWLLIADEVVDRKMISLSERLKWSRVATW